MKRYHKNSTKWYNTEKDSIKTEQNGTSEKKPKQNKVQIKGATKNR